MAVWIAVSSAGASAHAEEPASESSSGSEARDAFLLGTSLAKQERWAEALAAFERADRIQRHAVTTYNIGYCERALGSYTRARKAFRDALHGGADLPPELAAAAQEYRDEVEAHLARARVTVKPSGSVVALDGRPLERDDETSALVAGTRSIGLGEATPSAFDLLADPGPHVVLLSSGGSADVTLRVELRAGTNPPLTLVLPPRDVTPPRLRRHIARWDPTWATLSYGVSALGVVTGTVFGVRALQDESQLSDVCGSSHRCPSGYEDQLDRAKAHATAATLGFGVALVGAAIGTYLVLSRPSRLPEQHSSSAAPLMLGARF